MNMKNEDTFPTSDLPLATFLYARGILLKEIQDIPNEHRRKVFIFAMPPDDLLTAFQSGHAEINVLALNHAQNTLKGLVNER